MQTDSCLRAVRDNAKRMARSRATATTLAVLGALAATAAAAPTALVVSSPAHAAARQTIAVEPYVSKLASYAGVLAWSHWDSKAKTFRLSVHFRGHTELLPVAPRKVPFDVDLGPDAQGHTVAVYSRCRREEAVWIQGVPGARTVIPGGCALYRYSFASRRETRIAGVVGAGSGSFYLPTVWRNELAYVRARRSPTPALYAQPLTAPRGQRRIVAVALPGGTGSTPGPVALDLRGAELAFAWYGAGGSQLDSEIRLDTFSATRSLSADGLAAETSENRSPGFLGFPSLTTGGIFYGQFDGSAITPNDDAFAVIDSAGAGGTAAAPHALRSQTRDGNTTYAMFGSYDGTFADCGLGGCTLSAFVGLPYR
jgi:hypothetical protein